MPTYNTLNPGLNHVPSYQSSGKPFAKGGIDANAATKVEFREVTRWLYVQNQSDVELRVGFSEIGVSGSNYFTVQPQSGSTPVLEIKVSEIWLWHPVAAQTAKANVVAGLTNIRSASCASGSSYPSWSGSYGVG